MGPAFAGTIKEDSIVKQPNRHCEANGFAMTTESVCAVIE